MEGPAKGPGVVVRPSWWARRGQEVLPEGWKELEGPPGGSGWVERSGRAQEALPEVPEGSGGPHGEIGGVRRGRESIPKGREGSGDPRSGPGGVGKPCRRCGRGWKDLVEG